MEHLSDEFDELLELFFGEASESLARIYARLSLDGPREGLSLVGRLIGPHSNHARTLPATIPFVARAAADSLTAELALPDPCFWTPHLPLYYTVEMALERGDEVVARTTRIFGIRPLGTRGRNLFLQGKRWVLRGMTHRPSLIDAWRDASAAMLVDSPDPSLCEAASQAGVLLVARVSGHAFLPSPLRGRGAGGEGEIHRLSRWPAVGVVVVENVPPEGFSSLRAIARNLIFAQRFAAGEPVRPAAGAHAAICEFESPTELAARVEACHIPVIAFRPAGPELSVAEARLLCDALQRDLAPVGDFAGYVV